MSESDFNKIVSSNIKRYMAKCELTQDELAKRLNASQPAVSGWCNGTKTPRMDKVDAMCKIFNCKRSDLINAEGIHTPDAEPNLQGKISPQALQIAIAYDQADERSKVAAEVALGVNFLNTNASATSSGSTHIA